MYVPRTHHFCLSFSSSSFLTYRQISTSPSLQRQTRTSSRRSTLPSSWQPTCSTTLYLWPGVSPSAQNRSSSLSSRSPSSPTFGGSAASHGAWTVRSTTIGDSDGERSVFNHLVFFSGRGG